MERARRAVQAQQRYYTSGGLELNVGKKRKWIRKKRGEKSGEEMGQSK